MTFGGNFFVVQIHVISSPAADACNSHPSYLQGNHENARILSHSEDSDFSSLDAICQLVQFCSHHF